MVWGIKKDDSDALSVFNDLVSLRRKKSHSSNLHQRQNGEVFCKWLDLFNFLNNIN